MAKDLYDTSVEVHTYKEDQTHHEEGSLLAPETNMLILTWVVFFTLLAVLKKFAWKPILSALDQREKEIEESVDNADRLKEELEQLDQKQQEIIAQAEVRSKEIIEEARKAANEASLHIKRQAKEETQILLSNAEREINNQKDKALAQLKKESVQIAVDLAGKLIHENLDTSKNEKLINDYIKEI